MPTSLSTRHVTLGRFAACGLLALTAAGTLAQTGIAPAAPTTPAAAASSAEGPALSRPTPRLSSPSDAQRSLNLNNPQPEGRVTPQIRIPIGKKPDAPVLQRRPTDTSSSVSPGGGGVDDAVARCESQRGEQARVKCRDQLARQGTR